MNGMDKKDDEKRDIAYYMGQLTAFWIHLILLLIGTAFAIRIIRFILGI